MTSYRSLKNSELLAMKKVKEKLSKQKISS